MAYSRYNERFYMADLEIQLLTLVFFGISTGVAVYTSNKWARIVCLVSGVALSVISAIMLMR